MNWKQIYLFMYFLKNLGSCSCIKANISSLRIDCNIKNETEFDFESVSLVSLNLAVPSKFRYCKLFFILNPGGVIYFLWVLIFEKFVDCWSSSVKITYLSFLKDIFVLNSFYVRLIFNISGCSSRILLSWIYGLSIF